VIVVKRPAGEKHEDRGQGVEDRRWRAQAPFGVAANIRREPDDPGDERGLRKIAKGEIARPCPILGLVEEQIGPIQDERKQPDGKQHRKEDQQPDPIVLLAPMTLAPMAWIDAASSLNGLQSGYGRWLGIGAPCTMLCAQMKACY